MWTFEPQWLNLTLRLRCFLQWRLNSRWMSFLRLGRRFINIVAKVRITSLALGRSRFLTGASLSSSSLTQQRGAALLSSTGPVGLSGHLNVQAGWAPWQFVHFLSVAVHLAALWFPAHFGQITFAVQSSVAWLKCWHLAHWLGCGLGACDSSTLYVFMKIVKSLSSRLFSVVVDGVNNLTRTVSLLVALDLIRMALVMFIFWAIASCNISSTSMSIS